jgi:hypothetical protein
MPACGLRNTHDLVHALHKVGTRTWKRRREMSTFFWRVRTRTNKNSHAPYGGSFDSKYWKKYTSRAYQYLLIIYLSRLRIPSRSSSIVVVNYQMHSYSETGPANINLLLNLEKRHYFFNNNGSRKQPIYPLTNNNERFKRTLRRVCKPDCRQCCIFRLDRCREIYQTSSTCRRKRSISNCRRFVEPSGAKDV